MLCEGQLMPATARLADVSNNAAAKLLVEAASFCSGLHSEFMQGATASCIQREKV